MPRQISRKCAVTGDYDIPGLQLFTLSIPTGTMKNPHRSTWREAQTAPYEQRWNYEVFHYADDGNLSPERGIELCLRLSD